jgi:YggT family protein
MTGSLLLVARFIVIVLYIAIIGRVLLSWIEPRPRSGIGRAIYQATEPILGPIRRVLPSTGMIDLSPLVALLLLSVVAAAIGLR